MTIPADEHERTIAFADIALGQIRALRLPASPRHFEIWYTYATGYNPSLNQSINETLARNGTLSESDINHLYETFISPSRLTERIDRVGSKVVDEIEQVMAMIGAAAGNASNYSENLADVSQKKRGGITRLSLGCLTTASSRFSNTTSSSLSRPAFTPTAAKKAASS